MWRPKRFTTITPTASNAVPSRSRFTASPWGVTLRASNAKYANTRNNTARLMKYTASRRSITPRAMLEKWDRTPSDAAIAPSWGGRPTTRGSSPTRISANMTVTARMNAVIWLRVTLDAQTPTPASPRSNSAAPTYCAIRIPTWGPVPSARPSGMVSVMARASHRNSTWPAYLPSSSSSSLIGCASTTSSVPERASSARARIVTAGTRNRNTQGRKSSIGRSDATPYRSS